MAKEHEDVFDDLESPESGEVNLAVSEEQIIDALLKGGQKTPEKDIPLERLGIKLRIRALRDNEIEDIREKCTFYHKDRRTGLKLPETDIFEYQSWLIVRASTNVNWGESKLLKAYGATSPCDAVNKILLAGEKAEIVNEIEKLSGFKDETVEVVKKSLKPGV